MTRAGNLRPGRHRGDDGSRETPMVPRASFESYYGRPVLKPPVWTDDIAYYFFLGGLSAGCTLLGAGAERTGRPALRRGGRLGALASLVVGMVFLVKDLGRPERFHHMLRVAKPTSPMSMGTWLLTAYGPLAGLAAAGEVSARRRGRLSRLAGSAARPAGLAAAALAPAVASYTAVLLSHTAVPAWNRAQRELPFIFTASAAASAGGLGMIVAPPAQAGPARRLAELGAVAELLASRQLDRRPDAAVEAYAGGQARRLLQRAGALSAAGAAGSMLLGRRSRLAAAVSGAALLAGSLYERLGVLHAGIASTKDPRFANAPAPAGGERSDVPGTP